MRLPGPAGGACSAFQPPSWIKGEMREKGKVGKGGENFCVKRTVEVDEVG